MKNRYLLFLIAFVCSFGFTKAQTNLVPNPSFEVYDTCPNTLSQISRAVNWHSARTSPDYFNSCTSSSSSNWVPKNFWGYRYPASGNAYAGLAAKATGFYDREYIAAQLTTPLQIGIKYYLSLKVCLAYNPNFMRECAVNKMGALLSTINYTDINNAPKCNCSQVYSDSIITDSINWTMIKGSFIADSTYSYINIGNFFSNSLTDSIQMQGSQCVSYYYIDNVCLSDDSLYTYTYTGVSGINNIKSEGKATISPNPFVDVVKVEDIENNIEQIKIYDMMGRLLKEYDIHYLQEYTLNLNDLPAGNYNIVIHKKNSILSNIITKQ
jgi:hypothetical protein